MPKMLIAYCQKWEESERGWGTRPDGYCLHKTREEVDRYIKQYWESLPNTVGVPDEYDRPYGEPYACEVDQETYDKLQEVGSIRSYERVYPNKI